MKSQASGAADPQPNGSRPEGRPDGATRIGNGEIGGKARGLAVLFDDLPFGLRADEQGAIDVGIPPFTVVTTEVFGAFIERNNLRDIALSERPDHQIAHAFLQGEIPPAFLGAIRAISDNAHSPLAVRSSSLLEDALFRPFAGVYQTKMTPNNQLDPDERFRKLTEAIKLVWASTFFAEPKRYIQTTGRTLQDERMAVIIQDIVGHRHGPRFYPDVSGVARSYNFYPATNTTPEDGVVHLALGLGKLIVDGGTSWFYPPTRPRTPPPFNSLDDQIENTQRCFWAVNVGDAPAFNPLAETEYLVRCELADAEGDGTLAPVVSTFDPRAERLWSGLNSRGPRVLNFAPLLNGNLFGFNGVVPRLLELCEQRLGGAVEIEFAMTMPLAPGAPAYLGLLQVRPMLLSEGETTVTIEQLSRSDVVLASSRVIGNATDESMYDIVYVRPGGFLAADTRTIGDEIADINSMLVGQHRPYLLIGFGRWGSSDPWGGIPITWDQIAGARVIVEATLPNMNFEMSQASHFFHNLISFRVCYLMVSHNDHPGIDWAWLDSQEAVTETVHVRHVRLPRPLLVMVDGRSRRGVVSWTP